MRIIESTKLIRDLYHDLRILSPGDRHDFYQSKCDYYQGLVELSLMAGAFASICFLFSDYMINGSLFPTIFPRLSVLVPIGIFFYVTNRYKDWRITVLMDYVVGHSMVIAAMWTTYHLEDRSHAVEGIIIENLIWLVVGFVGSPLATNLNGVAFLIEILISHLFIHYNKLDVVIALEIPCMFGIIAVHLIMTAYYLDHYKVLKKLEQSMMTDPLTQVYNRHVLESIISQDSLKNVNPNEKIAVAMLDIDYFKKINDEHGHYTGDLALLYIGQRLSDVTLKGDYAIRYGGEEFVLIFRNCDKECAYGRMEDFRKEIEAATDTPVPFTVSVGVTAYDGDYSETLHRVDDALYEAKNAGRNRVVIK